MLPFLMFASPSTSPTNHSPRLRPLHSIRCHPERSEGSAFRLAPPRALSVPAFCSYPSPFSLELSIEDSHPVGNVNFPSLSPFPATLTDRSQFTENPATLSPLSATLTSRVKLNPFVCHSYKKHGGWRRAIVNFFVAQTLACAPLGRLTSASSESKHPQEFKNLAVQSVTSLLSPVTASALFLPPVTGHQSQVTKSCRIRTSAKPAPNPFGIRTSKTQHLKPFRMNTSKKTGGGEAAKLSISYSTKNFPGEHLAWASAPLVQSGELDSPHSEASLSDRRLLPCGLSTPGIATPLPYLARKFPAITCIDKRLRAADSLCWTRTAFPAAAVELAGELAVNFLRRNHVHHAP